MVSTPAIAQSEPTILPQTPTGFIRHVAVADGRHGDDGPPERVRDGLEEGVLAAGLGKVHGRREQNDTYEQEEYEETELAHARFERSA